MNEAKKRSESIGFFEKLFSAKEISGMGRLATNRLLRGRFARMIIALGNIFSYTSTRAYGCFFLSTGLFTLFFNLGEYYFADAAADVFVSLMFGLGYIALSLPFLMFDRPICIAFQDFYPTDFLFFEFFAIKRMHRTYSGKTVPSMLGFFIGIFPALLEFFTDPITMTVVLASFIFVMAALTFPEFPMIFTLLLLPYISLLPDFKLVISALALVSFISFILKVITGKRVLRIDIYSALIFAIMLLSLVGGIAHGGEALYNSFFLIIVLLGYFPTANLIMNRRIADCAINAIVVSAVPVSIISVIQLVLTTSGADVGANISASFSALSSLYAVPLVSAVFAFGFVLSKRKSVKKAAYFVVFLLDTVALLLSMSVAVWIAILLAIPSFWLVRSRRISISLGFLLFLLAHLIFLVPAELGDALSEFIGSERAFTFVLADMRNAFDVFSNNPWLGIGIADMTYADAAGATLASKSNLAIGIALELGVFVFLVFMILILLRLKHLSRYRIYLKGSNVQPTSEMSALAMLSLLFLGVREYIFADTLAVYLFFAVFAISSAALNVAKRETDDRLGYYSDARTAESSVIDISIF